MFQLIVAVISIALVAALALASIWYGGEAFTRGQLKAQVTTMINQAQQISGANTLYKTDNGGLDATDVAQLVAPSASGLTYLSADITPPSKITAGEWFLTADEVRVEISAAADIQKVTEAVDDSDVGGIDTTAGQYFYFPL